MLMLLIIGPKSLGKEIGVYFRPLIDNLKTLWETRDMNTYDVVDTKFKEMLLWTINDFPARNSLSGWSGQGYNEDTYLLVYLAELLMLVI